MGISGPGIRPQILQAPRRSKRTVSPLRLTATRKITLGFVALIGVLALQLVITARRNSITWDEDDHIYAGYMSLRYGDFGLNPEHPPLVKQLAAIPLLPMTLKVPPLQGREFKHEAFLGGKDFVFQNDAESIIFRTRMAAAALTLLPAALIFLAVREMFGVGRRSLLCRYLFLTRTCSRMHRSWPPTWA
jgi:hypothetical protein